MKPNADKCADVSAQEPSTKTTKEKVKKVKRPPMSDLRKQELAARRLEYKTNLALFEELAKTPEGRLQLQRELKYYNQAYDAFQNIRKSLDNIRCAKADGTPTALAADRNIPAAVKIDLGLLADQAFDNEDYIIDALKARSAVFPIYKEFISKVGGIGPVGAAAILGSINIYSSTTPSKILQYCGFNAGMVNGKKRVKTNDPQNYVLKAKDGEIEVISRSKAHVIVKTNMMIRGDKLTQGFQSPYNIDLRVKLIGVVAKCMIKQKGKYVMDHYYPRKERTSMSEKLVTETIKGGETRQIAWKDVSDGHRDADALRRMMKAFLADLYDNWRKLEGLSVRVPYQE